MKAKFVFIITATFVALAFLLGLAAKETQNSYAYTNNRGQTFAGNSAYISGGAWTTKDPMSIPRDQAAAGALDGKVYIKVADQSSPKAQSPLISATPCCKQALLTSNASSEIQDPLNDYVHIRKFLSTLDANVTTNTLSISIEPEIIDNPSGFWWFLYVLRLSDLYLYDQFPNGQYGTWWNGEWTQYVDSIDASIPANADVTAIRLNKTYYGSVNLEIQVRGNSLPSEKDIFFRFWIFKPGSTNWDYWIDIVPKAHWRPEWSIGWYWEICDYDSHFPTPGPEEDITQASITQINDALEFAMTLAGPNPQAPGFFQPAYWWALDTDRNGYTDVGILTYWDPDFRKWIVFLGRYLPEGLRWSLQYVPVAYGNNKVTVTVPLSVLQLPSNILRWQVGTRMVFRHVGGDFPLLLFLTSRSIDSAPGDLEWIDLEIEPVQVDLWIERIDVAQVVLADTKLACGKPTLIRVFARASGTQDVPAVVTVTVRDQNGNDLGAAPIPPTSDVALARAPQEGEEENSFNFLIEHPVECLTSTNTITITAIVNVRPKSGIVDINPSNNGMTVSKIFEKVPPVIIGWVPFEYGQYKGNLSASTASFLLKIYPGDVNFIRMEGIEPIKIDFNTAKPLRTKELVQRLKVVWRDAQSRGIDLPDRLYGAIDHDVWDKGYLDNMGEADPMWTAFGCGLFTRGEGRVAVGVTNEYVLAHEILHLLNSQGLHHAKMKGRFVCDADYPNETGLLDAPGIFFGVSRITGEKYWSIKSTESYYDIMTYAFPQVWISAYNYKKLFGGFEDYNASSITQTAYQPATSTSYLMVSGVIYSDTQRVAFTPVYPLGSLARPDIDEGGDYCLEERASTGFTLVRQCFQPSFSNYELGAITNEAYFIRTLPQVSGAVEIVLTHGGEVLGQVRASNFAPTVRLIRPNGGEVWPAEGTYTVSWEASDGDGDALKFSLYYSPDDGASWSPVALDVEGNQYTVTLSLYPGSERARFKVVASDGFLFAEDISDAPFRVIAKAPQAEILSPQSGATLAPGYGALLEGAASDIEDGPIPDDRLTWSSDVDGFLGTGRWIVVTLSPGYHNITLTATDSDGNRGTATIRVYVGYKVYLPLVLRNR